MNANQDRIREDAEAHFAQLRRSHPGALGIPENDVEEYIRLQRLALDLALPLQLGEVFPLQTLLDAADTDHDKQLALIGMEFVAGDYLDILEMEFHNDEAGFVPIATVQRLMNSLGQTEVHDSGVVLTADNVKIRYRRKDGRKNG